MRGKRPDIVEPIAQGRQFDRSNVEPIVEIRAKGALFYHLAQITIGRGEQPQIQPHGLGRADRLYFQRLDDAQELRLHPGR